jgi:outer membrane protein assembly factor BamB
VLYGKLQLELKGTSKTSRNKENDFTPAQAGEQIESHVLLLSPRQQRGRRERGKRLLFTLVAVLLAPVVVVGCSTLLTPPSHNKPQGLLTPVTGSGLYAYVGNEVYRLDNRSHQVVWKHTFASTETVQGDLSSSAPGQPFVVGSVLYLETRDQQHGVRQYLYALNTADGSVLWRQPSARALANSTAVYTLVESTTADSSTLTARDARTGKELWQRQYPIAGSTSDPGYGTDNTEGFRLITVTDQLLYAVVASHQNGQDLFARYGLSPADGSILWQNHEVIVGRMPWVEAHILNGVIYTTEYNLKSVTPYLDSHGDTVNEIPEARAAAYDVATGRQRWQTPYMVGEQPNAGFSLAVSSDMLYFQTFNNLWPATAQEPNAITTLHALNASDGTPRWQYQTKNSDSDVMTSAVLSGESLYFEAHTLTASGSQQELQLQIVALNAQTGQVRWSTPVKLLDGSEKTPTPVPNSNDPGFSGSYIVDMSPVASADTVYYSTPGNRIYAIQSSDGKILAQFWVDKTAQTTVLSRLVLFVGP